MVWFMCHVWHKTGVKVWCMTLPPDVSRVAWLIPVCDMTLVWCVKWRIFDVSRMSDITHESRMCEMTHFWCVISLIRDSCVTCDVTHSYVWHDSFLCVTRLIVMWDMPHSYVWHGSLSCMTRLIVMCDMTYQWCVTCLLAMCHMCDMTHWYVYI